MHVEQQEQHGTDIHREAETASVAVFYGFIMNSEQVQTIKATTCFLHSLFICSSCKTLKPLGLVHCLPLTVNARAAFVLFAPCMAFHMFSSAAKITRNIKMYPHAFNMPDWKKLFNVRGGRLCRSSSSRWATVQLACRSQTAHVTGQTELPAIKLTRRSKNPQQMFKYSDGSNKTNEN